MLKRLTIAIPAVQVICVLIVFSMNKISQSEYLRVEFVAPAREILIRLNFPLVCFWFIPFYPLEVFDKYLPHWSSLALDVAILLTATALIVSVAWFWYFVIVEVRLRQEGRSKIRFKQWWLEALKNLVLAAIAVAALAYA